MKRHLGTFAAWSLLFAVAGVRVGEAQNAERAPSRELSSLVVAPSACSPTDWKTKTTAWPAQYKPTTQFSQVFADAFPGKTLLDVLSLSGTTGLNALGREAVAALLNVAHPDVSDGTMKSTDDVIETFNNAYQSHTYDEAITKLEGVNRGNCPIK